MRRDPQFQTVTFPQVRWSVLHSPDQDPCCWCQPRGWLRNITEHSIVGKHLQPIRVTQHTVPHECLVNPDVKTSIGSESKCSLIVMMLVLQRRSFMAGYFLVLHKNRSCVFVQMKEDLSPRKAIETWRDCNLILEYWVSFYDISCCLVQHIYIKKHEQVSLVLFHSRPSLMYIYKNTDISDSTHTVQYFIDYRGT